VQEHGFKYRIAHLIRNYLLYSCFLVWSIITANGQAFLPAERQTIDSLKSLINKTPNSERRDTLYNYLDKTYEKVALRHRYNGNLEDGEMVIREAMKIALEGKHYHAYGSLHVNLGQFYREMGLIEQSIEILSKALRIQDTVKNERTIGTIYNNLGAAYFDNKETEKAFEYFEKAAELRRKGGDPYVGDAYWNIAFACKEINDTVNFHKYLNIAATYYQKMDDQDYGMGSYFFSKGTLHLSRNQFERSKDAFVRVVPKYKKLGYHDFVAWAYHGISRAYTGMGDYGMALIYADSSYQLSHQIGHLERIKQSAHILSEALVKKGDYKRALEVYKEHVQISDSIRNTSNEKALIRSEIKYRYDKKAAADSTKNAEERRVKDALLAEEQAVSLQKDTELKNQRLQQAILFGGLLIVIYFALFIFSRFRVIRKQKHLIEQQKIEVEIQREKANEQRIVAENQRHLVEEKNKEILDSINYARRLQEAILPPQKLVKEYLPDSFILYKPKDIVAGDFYWMESVGDTIYFAAADCTGHGVPGAMVSVVCSNALTKALLEDKITTPGKILDRTRELVIEQFARSEQEVKDGMDISLVALAPVGTDGHLSLQWSGANNPLWIIRNGEVLETKPDKQPIGKYAAASPFTTHTMVLQKGDTIYIFTDGFQDQFGGEKGKKYKAASLKSFLISIVHHPASKQRELLLQEFEQWRGGVEQIDDVCIMGVRI
jgi:serine phosphatase RsbU (regulator of sigma subunit)